jgi:PTS system nitrogen regulatory IIA component
MTTNIQTLYFDSVILDLKANNAQQVLKRLAEHTANLIGTSQEKIFDALNDLEKSEGCGVGQSIAIPHMRLPHLTEPMVIFASLCTPVLFNGCDDDPVDLICLVLFPDYMGAEYLSHLSMVTRAMKDHSFSESLREAKDSDDIRFLLKKNNEKKLAA